MLSERVQRIGFSSTLRIAAKAQQMRAEGIDVIDLSVGEPDFPTPANIKDAAKKALDRDQTKYTPNDGIIELRRALAARYRAEFSGEYEPSQVIVSTGAKQCLYNACIALINKGDEVIIPAPYWVSYPHMVNLANGTPVIVPTREEHGFRLTPEELGRSITPRTKAIILNNPSNPTGSAYSPEQLQSIISICLSEGVFIIADEIYEKLVYDGFRFKSVAAFGDRARENSVIISGFSKSYSMTGWRLGYALGPKPLIEGMSKVQSHATSNPTSISQWAGVEALTGPQNELDRMRQEFERRRNHAMYRLAGIPHCSCYKPEGAFYLFPNCSWYYDKQFEGVEIRNSAGLAYYLLKQAHVALIPGESFGADDFIRLSYSTSLNLIDQGITRISDALAQLKPLRRALRRELQNTSTKVRGMAPVQVAAPALRESLAAEAQAAIPYNHYLEWNAAIGGVQLKLVTNSPHLADFWAENWYPAPLESDVEPHGVIYAIKEAPGRQDSAFFSALTRTAFLFNSAYYPQLRSLALGLADDIVSRTADTFLVDGACLDVGGRGVALLAPPGTGGSTHLAALLRHPEAKLHSMNGFFVKFSGKSPIADSIERKFMTPTDLAGYLPELTGLFDRCKLENVVTRRDECEREGCPAKNGCPLERGEPRCYVASSNSIAILDPYWIGGAPKHLKRTELRHVILLQRMPIGDGVSHPAPEAGLRLLEDGALKDPRGAWRNLPFFNRYVHDLTEERKSLMRRHWQRLLNAAKLTVVNTEALTAAAAHERIWKTISER